MKILVSTFAGVLALVAVACFPASQADPVPLRTEEPIFGKIVAGSEFQERSDPGGTGIMINRLYTPVGASCRYDFTVSPDGGGRVVKSGAVSAGTGEDLLISVPLEGIRPAFDWGFKLACSGVTSDLDPVYDLSGRVDSSGDSESYNKDQYAPREHALIRSRDLNAPLVVVSFERIEVTGTLSADLAIEQTAPMSIRVTTSQGVEALSHTPEDPFKLGPVDILRLSSINPDVREEYEVEIQDHLGRAAQMTGHFNYDGSEMQGSRKDLTDSDSIFGRKVLIVGRFTMFSVPLEYPNPAAAEPNAGISEDIGGHEVSTLMETTPLDPRSKPPLRVNLTHQGEPIEGVVGVNDGKRTRELSTDSQGTVEFNGLRPGTTYIVEARSEGLQDYTGQLVVGKNMESLDIAMVEPLLNRATKYATWALLPLLAVVGPLTALAHAARRRSPLARLERVVSRLALGVI